MSKEIKTFEEMTREDLQKLRNEIVLNSCYFYDYNNSFGFYKHDICAFFDGYYDYLWELAEETYNADDITHALIIDEFDNIDNLEYWFNCYDDLSWIRTDNADEDNMMVLNENLKELCHRQYNINELRESVCNILQCKDDELELIFENNVFNLNNGYYKFKINYRGVGIGEIEYLPTIQSNYYVVNCFVCQ